MSDPILPISGVSRCRHLILSEKPLIDRLLPALHKAADRLLPLHLTMSYYQYRVLVIRLVCYSRDCQLTKLSIDNFVNWQFCLLSLVLVLWVPNVLWMCLKSVESGPLKTLGMKWGEVSSLPTKEKLTKKEKKKHYCSTTTSTFWEYYFSSTF